MEGVEIVVAQHGIEEIKKRRDQPRGNTIQEEGMKGIARSLRLARAGPKRCLSSLVVIACHHSTRSGKLLVRDRGRAQGRLIPGG